MQFSHWIAEGKVRTEEESFMAEVVDVVHYVMRRRKSCVGINIRQLPQACF